MSIGTINPATTFLVATSQGNPDIIVSNDGLNWFSGGSPFTNQGANKVAWNGSLWVAVGVGDISGSTKSIARSSDGQKWTSVAVDPFRAPAYSVAWNGAQWIATGSGTNKIAYSANGITWTVVTSLNTLFDDTVGVTAVAWNSTTNYWLAAGKAATPATGYIVARSADGINWTTTGTSIFSTNFNSLKWNGSIWVAVGLDVAPNNCTSIKYSTNGTSWTAVDSVATGAITSDTTILNNGKDVAWNGSLWLAVGSGGTTAIASSADGITWNPIGAAKTYFTNGATGVTWNGDRWLITGAPPSNCYTSIDAVTWTLVEIPIGGLSLTSITSGTGYVVGVNTITGLTLVDTTSSSGTITLPLTADQIGRTLIFKDKYGNFRNSSLTISTSFGDTFEDNQTTRVLDAIGYAITLVAGDDNVWYTTQAQQSNVGEIDVLTTSTVAGVNGTITFLSNTNASTATISTLTTSGIRFTAGGISSLLYMDSSKKLYFNDTLFPNTGTTGPTGTSIVGPTGATGVTGPYGVGGSTFSTLFTSTLKANFIASATYQSYGNTTFAANITVTNQSSIQYSADGYTWLPAQTSTSNTYIGRVVYANNTFVSYNANNNANVKQNDVLTSTDGQNWISSFYITGGKTITKINSIKYTNNNWWLAGAGGLLTSSDAINWISTGLDVQMVPYAVDYNGSKLIAVGSSPNANQQMYSSTDGALSWSPVTNTFYTQTSPNTGPITGDIYWLGALTWIAFEKIDTSATAPAPLPYYQILC